MGCLFEVVQLSVSLSHLDKFELSYLAGEIRAYDVT